MAQAKKGNSTIKKQYVGSTQVTIDPNGVLIDYTPSPPIINADNVNDTISASHSLGLSEIVVSINGGTYQPYAGIISVGNVSRAEGYYRFKIKAGLQRNESSIAASPAFTVTLNNQPVAPTLVADDAANTLTVTHDLPLTEILMSENGGPFIALA